MASKPSELDLIKFSVRVYQVLLNAYPIKFQQEYGSDMVQVFQDCCLRAFRQGGMNGMARLWAVTLFDLVQSVISEHAQKEIEMKKEMKPEDIRKAGWAFILGGIALAALSLFVALLGDSYWFLLTGILSFLCLPLLAVGMLGLRSRFGDKAGGFGKSMLLVGAILGPITSVIGFVLQGMNEFWTLIFNGATILFVCLALFGLVGLYKKPLPSWNILPIIAGVLFPLLWLSAFLNSHSGRVVIWKLTGHWYVIPGIPEGVAWILLLIQCIALAALGYILKSDVPEETAVPA